MKYHFICFFVLMIGFVFGAFSQAPDYYGKPKIATDTVSFYEFKVIEGSTFFGRVVKETEGEITIKSNSGTIKLQKGSIVSKNRITEASAALTGEIYQSPFEFRDRNTYQSLLGQTAFTMRKGDRNVGQIIYAVTQFNYGVTDNFQLGFGTVLPLIFRPIVYLHPKYGFQLSKNTRFAIGSHLLGVASNYDSVNYEYHYTGLTYGVFTFGSEKSNFTLGGGYGATKGIFKPSGMATLAGSLGISERVSLMGEVFYFPDYDQYSVFSFGLRLRYNERSRWDFMITGTSFVNKTKNPAKFERRGFPDIPPIINYSYNF